MSFYWCDFNDSGSYRVNPKGSERLKSTQELLFKIASNPLDSLNVQWWSKVPCQITGFTSVDKYRLEFFQECLHS